MAAILFGKLPAHGDFVSRGLLAPERDELDRWLSAGLAEARDALGSAFDDRFETVPPWRFAWNQGVEGWTAGALAPSIDASGRRYPLLLACTNLPEGEAGPAARTCEDMLYEALAKGWNADDAIAAVERRSTGAAAATDTDGAAQEGWWLSDGEGRVVARLPGRRPAELLASMLAVRETAE